MRVLITGGAGFIGSHTADALLADGCQVRVLDSLEPPVHQQRIPPSYLDERVEFCLGDVRDESVLLEAMRGCDVVYHFAAFQDYLPCFSRYFDVNVTSTALLYELIEREKLPVRKVIVASSQATLGEGLYHDADGRAALPDIRSNSQLAQGQWEIQAPAGFRDPLQWQRTGENVANPKNPYGMSKIAAENIAMNLGRRYEIPSVGLRYSIVQGPRQSFLNAYSGACRVFCLSFHEGLEPPIYEDGQQIRDFINIHDAVDANMLVLHDDRADYEVFNVGGGRPITVLEFAKIVADVYERTDYQAIPGGKYRVGDTRHICSDIGKLESLGWTPTRNAYQSVEAYRAWLDEADSSAEILMQCNSQLAELDVVRELAL